MSDLNPRTVVKATGLTKTVFAQNTRLTILSDLSLNIKAGESLAIVGVSGSGKSTLLGLLAGLDVASEGEVLLCGENLNTLDEDGRARVRGENVGFVFQSFQLLATLTAYENVLLPLEINGSENPDQSAKDWLERVGLSHRIQHYPHQLSGGEQQRVAIARAFASTPSVLFADEPTGNLDAATGAKVIDLLFEINQERATTLIMVTHDEQLASRCQRRIRLDGGRIVATEPGLEPGHNHA